MAIKTVGWNVARNLSSPDKAKKVLDSIDKLDADLVVLSESADKSGVFADRVEERLRGLGYLPFTTEYKDAEEHPSVEQHITVLSRLVGTRLFTVRLAGRNAIMMNVLDPTSNHRAEGIAEHAYDTSEAGRIAMNQAALALHPDFIIGDLNTTPEPNPRATAFSMARFIPHPRAKSLGSRLHEMQRGEAYQTLIDGGMADAGRGELTMTFHGIGIAALDHLMYKPGSIAVTDFAVPHDIPGSDHRPITANMHVL